MAYKSENQVHYRPLHAHSVVCEATCGPYIPSLSKRAMCTRAIGVQQSRRKTADEEMYVDTCRWG